MNRAQQPDIGYGVLFANEIIRSMPRCRSILDVGCGAASMLTQMDVPEGSELVGVDIDPKRIEVAKALLPRATFLVGNAEGLELPSEHFDLVVCRFALPYMDVPAALGEFYRVLSTGGTLYLALHDASFFFDNLKKVITSGSVASRLKSGTLQAYAAANSLAFHWTGRMFHFFGRIESFQFRSSFTRELKKLGFIDVEWRRYGQLFLVRCTKS